MADIIHLLSDDLANKIAAGEVVVRPAAVVKELLENAIDAGATELQLIIRDGGKLSIQVIDNGSGMSETDARMAFERHATSKIRDIDDLFSINTMGFRGEALASIAAVSKVNMKTRQADEQMGTELIIEGAQFVSQAPCQSPTGTSITVKSLFYNVPARRKFLKSDSVETKHIIEEFVRIALANPHVKLQMHNNEKEVYHLQKQPLRRRIASIFGKKQDNRIIEVEEETDIVSVSGYIGKPEFAKKTRGEQYFFINNRYIKSSYLHHAVQKAFADFINAKEYPLYVLKLQIDPSRVDINVHPSKHEVKFEDERHIYTIVSAAVRHALSKFAVTPTLDFGISPSFNKHEFFQTNRENVQVDNQQNKGRESTFLNRQSGSASREENWQELYTFSPSEQKQIEQIQQSTTPAIPHLVQVQGRYILAEVENGFLLIDQRRAHQRILYESFVRTSQISSQKSLFPETIELSEQSMTIFRENRNRLNQLGLQTEQFGPTSIIIHATPADIQLSNLQEFIETLLVELSMNEEVELRHTIAKHLAIYGSIRHGQKLSFEEMQSLYQQLMNCEQPNYGIRRDKTSVFYSLDELNQAFRI